MEPQEYYGRKNNCKCLGLVMAIIFALLLGTIGLILGAVFSVTLLGSLAVLIASAAILVVLLILTIIYKICACSKRC